MDFAFKFKKLKGPDVYNLKSLGMSISPKIC
jgi:hypothetical protein